MRYPDYCVLISIHGYYSEGRMPGSGVTGISTGQIARPDFEDTVLKEIKYDPSTSTQSIVRHRGIDK